LDQHYSAELRRLALQKGHIKSKRAYTALLHEFLEAANKEPEDISDDRKEIRISRGGF